MPFFQGSGNVDLNNAAFLPNYHSNPAYNFRPVFDNVFEYPESKRVEVTPGATIEEVISEEKITVEGWTVHVDADGHKYYERDGKLTNDLRVVEQSNKDVATDSVQGLDKDGWDEKLVDTMINEGQTPYELFIDHSRWYASSDKSKLSKRANEHREPQEVFELQTEYWRYMTQYPAHRSLPDGAEEAARRALNCFLMEGLRLRSDTTAPFSQEESKQLLNYLQTDYVPIGSQNIPPTAGIPSESAAKTALVSWILWNAATHRGLNLYGNKAKGQEFRSPLSKKSVAFFCIATVCFGVPHNHLESIVSAHKASKLRGDNEAWPTYIKQLSAEWTAFNLAATVLLSSSVGFLAVPGLDPRSRIASLLSIVLTLASVITGVYHLWSHGHAKAEYNISTITPRRSKILAIILSMPFVTLVWGVFAFLVAVILYAFFGFQPMANGTNPSMPHYTSWLILGFGAGVAVLMALIVTFFQWRLQDRERRRAAKHD
ncbi:hypothetical protein PLICRDRAFT_174795 [Plicaturopsis crispa FD-325 SS-3]|nr:hypothetical protein PLICRDRAFT_174795 [Plicaturopsis crispa FD-325 SS-3]